MRYFNTIAIRRAILATAAAAGCVVHAQSVPTTLNYQGRLTDNTPQQAPVTGIVTMQFELWDAPSGGNRVWREPDVDGGGTDIPVNGGVFSIQLGQANPIPPALFAAGQSRYLQTLILISRTAPPEILQPRQQITTTGFSALAQSAQLAADSAKLGGADPGAYQKTLNPAACGAGYVLTAIAADGTATCVPDQSGITSVNNGGGITGAISGGSLTLGSDATVQRRSVAPTCPAGNYLKSLAADGTPACSPDQTGISAVNNSGGVTGSISGGTLTLGSDATVQRRSVAPACPAGQYLQSIAGDGTPACVADSGATAPLALTGNLATPVFSSSNSGAGYGINAQSNSGIAIYATSSAAGLAYPAVFGYNSVQASAGSLGSSLQVGALTVPAGVIGSSSGYGVYGATSAAAGFGVYGGNSVSNNYGRLGDSQEGVYGGTSGGVGVRGEAQSGSGTGVIGYSNSNAGTGVSGGTLGGGTGVYGGASGGTGVRGSAASGIGVQGDSGTGNGVYGASNSGYGVNGFSATGIAVNGYSNSNSGYGVWGSTLGGGIGVYGNSTGNDGVKGASGTGYGVEGVSSGGAGVYGHATAASGASFGVSGQSDSAAGSGVRAIGAGGAGTALQIESGGIRAVGAGVLTPTAAFIHIANAANKPKNNVTCIDDVMTNGQPNAILLVTMVADNTLIAGNNPIPFYLAYNPQLSGSNICPAGAVWAIITPALTTIQDQMRFHVLVIYP